MKPAFARMVLSAPFFAGAAWLFEYTLVPYVFPFLLFLAAMYLFFKGAMRYLRKTGRSEPSWRMLVSWSVGFGGG